MSFNVAADGYERYIGRYSRLLAPRFLEFSGVADGPVLEVGCGPGSLTEVLAARVGGGERRGDRSFRAVRRSVSGARRCF